MPHGMRIAQEMGRRVAVDILEKRGGGYCDGDRSALLLPKSAVGARDEPCKRRRTHCCQHCGSSRCSKTDACEERASERSVSMDLLCWHLSSGMQTDPCSSDLLALIGVLHDGAKGP